MQQGQVLEGVSQLIHRAVKLEERVNFLEGLVRDGKMEKDRRAWKLQDVDGNVLCECKVVGISLYEDDCDGYREMLIIRVRQEDSVWLDSFYSDLCDALKDKYSNEVCGCEHDCCGCVQQSVTNILDLGHLCYAINVTGVRNI
jgi:hypothetical protein